MSPRRTSYRRLRRSFRFSLISLVALVSVSSTAGGEVNDDERKFAAEVKALDPNLVRVVSTSTHRFLQYRHCSPEHCWSRCFLQWLPEKPDGGSVLASVAIEETGVGTMSVSDARWDWQDEKPRLVIRYSPLHLDTPETTLVIRPGAPGRYQVVSDR